MTNLLLTAYHFGPTTTKAATKAAATASAAAKAGGENSSSSEGIVIALGLLGVLIVLGLVAFVVLRVVQKKDDAEYAKNKFVPARKWGWEQSLGEAEEAALLRGLQAWEKDGKGLNLGHEEGTASLYLPGRQVVVSLWLLADRFRGLGAAGQDPAAVGRLVDELAATPQPGVLAYPEEWFPVEQLDGMDKDAFIGRVRDLLNAGFDQGLPGSHGWYSDENYGRIDLKLLASPSDEARRLRDADQYEASVAAESKNLNVLLLTLAPLVGRYQAVRASEPAVSPDDVIRRLLGETLAQPGPDVTWSRVQASPTELALVQASAAGRSSL